MKFQPYNFLIMMAAVGLAASTGWAAHEFTEMQMQENIQEAYELGYADGSNQTRKAIMEPVQEFDAEGYSIQFMNEKHPTMEWNKTHDVLGYTNSNEPGDINLRANMSKQQTYETCVHEHLHDLGIGSTYHYYIEMWESQIQDPMCLEVVDRANVTNGEVNEGPYR